VHLFDVAIEGQAPIGESKRFAPGDAAVIVGHALGPWGLSDLLRPALPYFYRRYGQEGVSLIFIPSAFTVPTGRAHWEVLIRARAIETGAFVLAPAQAGTHADGRETWGHAMAVDPWGSVLADLGTEAPGLAVVDLDLARVAAARRQIPALETGREVPLRRV
jgi:predicted amidohydrolase